jgi:DNA-binding Lrp family transcriptional regulator
MVPLQHPRFQIKLSRAVLQRIKRLQEKKIIQGYTTILNPDIIAEKISIALLLKFKPSAEPAEIERLDYYLTEASFCLCGKTRSNSRI